MLSFAPVLQPDQLRLDYRRTLIPPKKYLLPPRDVLLSYSAAGGYQPCIPEGKVVLFGLHPCDLRGIAYLDTVFLGAHPDPWYRARRDRLTLIGLSCAPDDYCFCGDITAGADACDLFMRQAPQGFHLKAFTAQGRTIIQAATGLLTEGDAAPADQACSAIAERIELACSRGETFPDSPLWEDFAKRCLSCGACSLCCPTCYCFDVRENPGLDGETALRIREWDNCLFKAHGEVAGGHNFRKTRLERFHYRYRHKYLGFGPTRGMVSCVGCGRCRQVCPVGIDLLELFKDETHD